MEDLTKKTEEELRVLEAAGKAAIAEMNRRFQIEADEIEYRVETFKPFKREELRFAKDAKCPCGAKLAYPKKIGIRGSWHCSDVLLDPGKTGVKHTEPLPFAFYEIKSEEQS